MGVPELQRFAVKVLSQCSSSSACERNWSAFDFIHNNKRYRLLPSRARDLVYVFTNGRLAHKMSRVDDAEAYVPWYETEEEEGEDWEL